jgi:hypothetical protein
MPSNKAKQKWNATNYTQVKVSIDPVIASAFKDACAVQGKSLASVLSKFMADYGKTIPKKNLLAPKNFDTRKKRRAATKKIVAQLEEVLSEEERYFGSVPDNLHGSKWHEASGSSISTLQDAIDVILDIYCD